MDEILPMGVEITEEMIEMGILEAREHPLGGSLSELVTKIFIAMMDKSHSIR